MLKVKRMINTLIGQIKANVMVSQFIMKTCFEQKNIASLVLVPSTY